MNNPLYAGRELEIFLGGQRVELPGVGGVNRFIYYGEVIIDALNKHYDLHTLIDHETVAKNKTNAMLGAKVERENK